MSENLPAHAEIVVIGGGIVGCSTAYHLARDHKADVIVLEQNQLTSGSTWHAAGLVGQLRSSASITQVLRYSVSLYERLEAETGLATGWKMTGCLRLATNAERMTEFRRLATTARSFGMEMHLISPAEVAAMWPLMDVSDLVGASFLPTDGQASPSDITQSLAKGARTHGARFFEGVRVAGFGFENGRIVRVETDSGVIACDKVVNCGGQWARQIGALAGVSVPLQPMKHQYVVTEPIPGLARDAPTLRDPDRGTYFKEEVGGLVMGGYEPDPQAWTSGDVPDDFAFRLFDDDFDHFEPHMLNAIARVPALAKVGVRRMIHAPESFTSDGNFILGRAPECANFFVGAGFNAFGIASGGGAGWVLAQWVMSGEAPLDLWPVDIRRFSAVHADRDWLRERVIEATAKHYAIAFPHEEYLSGRPRLASPLYDRLKARGAVFGSKLGWERANWFAPPGVERKDEYAMGRQNWFAAVGEEHRAARERVAVFDQSSFAKFELRGVGAERALDFLCAGDVAKPPGRLTYTQLLNSRGGVECDLTVARLAADRFTLVTGTGFRTHDAAWIRDHIPDGLDIRVDDVTEERATLAVMGPRARELLARISPDDLGSRGVPFRACPQDWGGRPRGDRDARHLCRRTRLGAAYADGRRAGGFRRADERRREFGRRARRLPRDRVAASREGLPGLGRRHHAQRQSVRGGPRLRGEPRKARFSRPHGAAGGAGQAAEEAAREFRLRRRGRRLDRPRDDPARRRAGRLSLQRRLWLYLAAADRPRLRQERAGRQRGVGARRRVRIGRGAGTPAVSHQLRADSTIRRGRG